MTTVSPKKEIALITGASRGLGAAAARALAASGCFVCINYRQNENAAKTLLDEIQAAGGEGERRPFDVADPAACEAALKDLIHTHGRVDILVNNAGIRRDSLLVRMKPRDWHAVMDINLNAFYHVTRPVVKNMIRNRYGRIVTITSASGQAGVPGQVNYSAAKAGLIGATKALSREVASRNITVNAVSPGYIDTEMIAGLDAEKVAATIPMGTLGTPEDVAAAVTFFCSAGAGYITGQVLGVNGGIL